MIFQIIYQKYWCKKIIIIFNVKLKSLQNRIVGKNIKWKDYFHQ